MKILKKLFYSIMILIMLCCAGMLILALSPGLTNTLSLALYGEDGASGLVGKHLQNSGSAVYPEPVMTVPAGAESPIAEGVLAGTGNAAYVAPLRGSMNLSEKVSGKNGYEPIKGAGEQLADEQANELGATLHTGPTGDGLTFDAVFYPYYHMLNERMQHIYRQIYANATSLNASFAPVEQVNTGQLKNVFEAVYNDHPELFWLDTSFSCKYRSDNTCVEVTLFYNRTAQQLEQYKAEFESRAQKILTGAGGQVELYDKEKYVHDALVKEVEYSPSSAMNQSAYSAIVNGDTVCAGYSRAFQYLMQQMGIPCYYCTGYSGQEHAWNIIKLEDGYHNVDVTWDDTNPSTYDYFNKSDADFVGTHVRTGLSVYLPPCGEGYDGIAASGTVAESKPAGIKLNPNPQQPLIWEPKDKDQNKYHSVSGNMVSGNLVYNLDATGLVDEDVIWTLQDYYADCKKQMVAKGIGKKTFYNVVPKYLLDQMESAYGTGAYEKGYTDAALKELKRENLAIQLQVVDLGGNYYRVHHNYYIW